MWQKTAQDVRAETTAAWESYNATRAQIQSIEKQIKASELALKGVIREANVGSRTVLDVLDAEQEHLDNPQLQQDLISVFSGVNRSSGSEEFLEEMFLNGQYEAVITYESSLINMNKKLVEQGKEPLYIIYTKDGVSLSDAPFAYIDHKNKEKSDTFNDL